MTTRTAPGDPSSEDSSAESAGASEGFLPKAALATVVVALALTIISSVLQVPGGWGIEDFLRWIDIPGRAPGSAMVDLWSAGSVRWVAFLYLCLDTLVFVPVYLVFFLGTGTALHRALTTTEGAGVDVAESGEERTRWKLIPFVLLVAPVCALAALDLVENALGMVLIGKGGVLSWIAAVAVGCLAMGVLAFARRHAPVGNTLHRSADYDRLGVLAGLVLALVVGAGFGAFGDACKAAPDLRWVWPDSIACGAHRGKVSLVGIVVVVQVLAAALWLFGGGRAQARSGTVGAPPPSAPPAPGGPPPSAGPPPPPAPSTRRQLSAALRIELWDIVVRSRYVLLILATFAALTLGIDQARDVMYAVAAFPWQASDGGISGTRLAGSLAVYLLSCLGVWSLAFACWLWTRCACLVVAAGRPIRGRSGPADTVARLWARTLGLAPYVFLVLLCCGVLEDTAVARYAAIAATATERASEHGWIMVSIVAFATSTVLLSLVYVNTRVRKSSKLYYNARAWTLWAADAQLVAGPGRAHEKYRLLGFITPFALPFAALGLAFLARAGGLLPHHYWPSVAFPIIAFTLTFWLCVLGWLSVAETVRAVPWFVLLVAAMGVFGLLGLTSNQQVWSSLQVGTMAPQGPDASGLFVMLLFSFLLAALALAVYAVAMHYVAASTAPSALKLAGVFGTWLLVVVGVLFLADQKLLFRKVPDLDSIQASKERMGRPPLASAMVQWLDGVCGGLRNQGCGGSPTAGDVRVPVYFVSTMGGGIRAAVWTTSVLNELSRDKAFLSRTFSISGVSGGAVGAAAFRACSLQTPGDDKKRTDCLKSFAATDLVTPLLSGLLFEDVLAKFIPTSWCDTPGCGFLSRGAWFEASLEAGLPAMRNGLWASRQALPGHTPYLLLNSTWVESGERAIASDLQVRASQFPGAKDQLAIADHDLPLGTAAHNAARFPYINPIGELRGPRVQCELRDDDRIHENESVQNPAARRGKPESCGHLADGGYFDNGGGQSSIDALNAMVRCLTVSERSEKVDPSGTEDPYAVCRDLPNRGWMQAHLQPTIIFIRNGTNPITETAADCSSPSQPEAAELEKARTKVVPNCRALTERYRPERPACRKAFRFYVDALGPPLALYNGAGTGAHGQLSEAAQMRSVEDARLALAAAVAASAAANTRPAAATAVAASAVRAADVRPIVTLDQLPDGVRYPLGWHLSSAAASGLQSQAEHCGGSFHQK